MRLSFSVAAIVAAVVSGRGGVLAQSSLDSVRIVSVSPADSLVRGVPVLMHIQIESSLQSTDSAAVMVGFNSTDPDGWHMQRRAVVRHGKQRIVVAVTTAPVDWGQGSRYNVKVSLMALPFRPPLAGLATDRRFLPVKH